MKSLITRFIKDESGATAIEYGLIAAGIAVLVVALLGPTGPMTDTFDDLWAKIRTSAGLPAAG
ncbi:Flp family type IVb pilin [Microvirga sp. 0TCS3.31]